MREHTRIVASINTIIKPLLKPHVDDLEKKIAPGLAILSWTSMNVDGYIHRLTQVPRSSPAPALPRLLRAPSTRPTQLLSPSPRAWVASRSWCTR